MPRLNNSRIVKINNMWKLKVPPHRVQQWKQDWEKKRLTTLYSLIKEGTVVYYVGAESGDIPALLAKWGARLYLFEPNHTAWPTIKTIFDMNKLERPDGLFAMFAGAETELIPKNPDKDLFGGEGWKLVDDDKDPCNNWPKYANDDVQDVGFSNLSQEKDGLPIVAIDDVVSQIDPITGAGTKIPDIISIDVEGAEMEVLKGAEATIDNFKPTIFLSLHPELLIQQYGIYSREVRNWLIDKGYKETLLEYEHEVHLLYKAENERIRPTAKSRR